jgi:hypothetical protein
MCSIPDGLNVVASISDAPNTAAQLYHLLASVADHYSVDKEILIPGWVASIWNPGTANRNCLTVIASHQGFDGSQCNDSSTQCLTTQ